MLNLKLLLLLFFVSSVKITIIQANNLDLGNSVFRRSQDSDLPPLADQHIDRKPAQCDSGTIIDDWVVIQRRQDGSEDFYRTWDEYENGFGDIDGEFFIGLKKLHALTNDNGPQEFMIILEDNNGTEVYAKYNSFAIADESESYKLKRVGKYSGTAGNSLSSHVNMKFTTKDRDNDLEPKYNCAVRFTGAWWYTDCHTSNLNGKYGDNTFGRGITWFTFRGHSVSLPYVIMMIRRARDV